MLLEQECLGFREVGQTHSWLQLMRLTIISTCRRQPSLAVAQFHISRRKSDWGMCSFCLFFRVDLLALLSHLWAMVLPSHKVFHGCSQFRCYKSETSGDESLKLRMGKVSRKQENRLCENLILRVDSQTRKDPDLLVLSVMSSFDVLWEIGLKFVAVFKKKKRSVFAAPGSELYFFLIWKKWKMEKNSAWSYADTWFLSW